MDIIRNIYQPRGTHCELADSQLPHLSSFTAMTAADLIATVSAKSATGNHKSNQPCGGSILIMPMVISTAVPAAPAALIQNPSQNILVRTIWLTTWCSFLRHSKGLWPSSCSASSAITPSPKMKRASVITVPTPTHGRLSIIPCLTSEKGVNKIEASEISARIIRTFRLDTDLVRSINLDGIVFTATVLAT